NFDLVPLPTDPSSSKLLKNLLFDQNLSSQPCITMEDDQWVSFSNYGLQWCLKELSKEELQTFKKLLRKKHPRSMSALPWAEVDNANTDSLASLLHEYYERPAAWTMAIDIFEEMKLLTLSEKARDEMKKHSADTVPEDAAPVTTDQGPSKEEAPVSDDDTDKRDYKAHVKSKFAIKSDAHNGSENAASDWPEMQMLVDIFNSDQRGFRPRTVVLHGRSGVGKSALARRVILRWAEGVLYRDLFNYVFFLHARDIEWREESSFAELLAREWPHPQFPATEILSRPEKLLFILDSFDDLDSALGLCARKLCTDWTERRPRCALVHSLLKKALLPESSLLVTVRDVGMEQLKSLIVSPLYLVVGGISVQRRIQLLLKHIPSQHRKMQVLHSVMDNPRLFDQCQVPAVCLLICTALELQEAVGKSLAPTCQTLTGLYATFVFHQPAPGAALQRCLSQEERAVLKGLCHMAVQGVWSRKSVFSSNDLRAHGLRASELSSMFPMSLLLPLGGHREKCYAFIHLSLQDFFAALYYVLEALEKETSSCSVFFEAAQSWLELKQTGIDFRLARVKHFLFGLMSREVMRTLEIRLGCPVPQGVVKQELLHWVSLLGRQATASTPADVMESFHCLFETQDEDFVLSALHSFQDVRLPINRRMDLIVSSFCLQHCRRLRRIRVDVKDLFLKDEFAAWPTTPQWMQTRTLMDESWENFCSVLATHPSLRQLDLGSSILSDWAMKVLCAKLRHPACRIQTLILKGAQVAPGLQHLWVTLVMNRNIKHLNLGSTVLKEKDIKMACEALKHPNSLLESLRLDSCGLTQTCYLMISQVVHKSTSLKTLSIAGNKVTDWGLKPLCDALRLSWCFLQRLILENCGLTAVSCQVLALALTDNRSLTHLCLSNNNPEHEGLSPLSRAIPDSGLQWLLLDQCNLDVAGCGYLAFALKDNRRLTHLSLNRNPLGDSGVKLLYEVMREPSCHLQDLEVADCRLTAACCGSLSHVIVRSKHLKSLDLAGNALGDTGMAALCEGLKQRTSVLERLGLEACGLTSDCCGALLLALAHNQHLTSLNLVRNNFSPNIVRKLCSAFARPTSNLRIIGLWKEQYPAQTQQLLEELQRLKPGLVVDGDWYSHVQDDRYWWKD
ncbi:NACHT, LRR and PYD domains-containing protein 5, partial [Lepus europaeus]|uniref:NACHT, LRR and PYD domains-containing protein 5 n=1 Tax=Lepus europaeus TaxID=9983 RepID=UPI002B48F9D4